jgi:ABC-type Fe3+/spermidine/putrescine transport system ATPase subunit
MLRLEELHFSFDRETPIFKDASMHLDQGGLYGLMGVSGSGKTTLLNIIAGFLNPQQGKVKIGDREVTPLLSSEREIGYVFQDYGLFPNLSVFDNIAFGLKVLKLKKREIERLVNDLLVSIKMSDFKNSSVNKLSGGQKQRVALARSLAVSPKIMLLDEVFSAVDNELKEEVRAIVRELLIRKGITSILVSHSFNDICQVCDSVMFVFEKRIYGPYLINELVTRPNNARIAKLAGIKNVFENKLSEETKTKYNLKKKYLFINCNSIEHESNTNTLPIYRNGEAVVDSQKMNKFSFSDQTITIPSHLHEGSTTLYVNLTKVKDIDE